MAYIVLSVKVDPTLLQKLTAEMKQRRAADEEVKARLLCDIREALRAHPRRSPR